MALLEVNDLAVRYKVTTPLFRKQRYLYAVNGVSFSLDRGETLGLVGESGCGKSTLGKALVKLEQPYRGSITLDGVQVTVLAQAIQAHGVNSAGKSAAFDAWGVDLGSN